MGRDDADTIRDIARARELFETHVVDPDSNNSGGSRRKTGSAEAREKATGATAGRLSFGVAEDADENVIVQTTQFSTEDGFQGKHVALLLAYDLREHYRVAALHASGYPLAPDGSAVIASLRRRGIMAKPEKTEVEPRAKRRESLDRGLDLVPWNPRETAKRAVADRHAQAGLTVVLTNDTSYWVVHHRQFSPATLRPASIISVDSHRPRVGRPLQGADHPMR